MTKLWFDVTTKVLGKEEVKKKKNTLVILFSLALLIVVFKTWEPEELYREKTRRMHWIYMKH